jgi:hypothetical protein
MFIVTLVFLILHSFFLARYQQGRLPSRSLQGSPKSKAYGVDGYRVCDFRDSFAD